MLRRSGGTIFAGEEISRSPTLMLPRSGARNPGDQAQRRGLAAAGGPEQAGEQPMLDAQRDVVDRGDAAELLRQMLELDDGHPLSLRPVMVIAGPAPAPAERPHVNSGAARGNRAERSCGTPACASFETAAGAASSG